MLYSGDIMSSYHSWYINKCYKHTTTSHNGSLYITSVCTKFALLFHFVETLLIYIFGLAITVAKAVLSPHRLVMQGFSAIFSTAGF